MDEIMKERVEGHQNLVKDSDSGVIINRGDTDRERYRIAKRNAIENAKTREELDKIKNDLDDIKHILKQLIR